MAGCRISHSLGSARRGGTARVWGWIAANLVRFGWFFRRFSGRGADFALEKSKKWAGKSHFEGGFGCFLGVCFFGFFGFWGFFPNFQKKIN
jgi:hypothetical protein